MRKSIIFILLCGYVPAHSAAKKSAPRLVLTIIVDQLAHHELEKLQHNLTGGLAFMAKNAVVFDNAYVPHATPDTAVGHASLATGALPKEHGIVGNYWYNSHGTMVTAYSDKSARDLMVDTLSDQALLRNSPQQRYASVALSFKTQAAIALAGHLGLPIWFDVDNHTFTTSKAYSEQAPGWVQKFNAAQHIHEIKKVTWNLAYEATSKAYQYNNIKNYTFAGSWSFAQKAPAIAGTTFALDSHLNLSLTPAGNALLTDLAITAIDTYADYEKPDHFLLWVSMSGLDKIGHPYGPDSLEALDMLYHTDLDIQRLISHAYKRYGAENTLVVVAADHGVMPIPEYVHKAGYAPARRILAKDLVHQMNKVLAEKHGHTDMVQDILSNNVYLHPHEYQALPYKKRMAVLNTLKQFLTRQPGIKRVWSQQDLAHSDYHLNDHEIESFFKNQIVPSRSGQLYIQVSPYTLISSEEYGTNHASPYDYDTHIPLMVYQKGKFERKRIMNIVWTQQLAPSLAYALGIPRPSACTYNVLPGLFA